MPCPGCDQVADMTWPQALSHFYDSVKKFKTSGMAMAGESLHVHRFQVCQGCEKYRKPFCTACKCVALVKTKVLVETCPLGKW